MQHLERALKETVDLVREQYELEGIDHIDIEITLAGRLDKVSIEYSIGEFYSDKVKGTDLMDCVTEYARRQGWNRRQQAKLLEAPKPPDWNKELDDEIPF